MQTVSLNRCSRKAILAMDQTVYLGSCMIVSGGGNTVRWQTLCMMVIET